MRFRLSPEFRGDAILKAQSGRKYRSLDARCAACTVKGGREKRCADWPKALARENPHRYPCPRREWPDRESPELYILTGLGAREDGHLFSKRWEISFGDLPADEQARLFDRLLAAYADEAIASVYWPAVS